MHLRFHFFWSSTLNEMPPGSCPALAHCTPSHGDHGDHGEPKLPWAAQATRASILANTKCESPFAASPVSFRWSCSLWFQPHGRSKSRNLLVLECPVLCICSCDSARSMKQPWWSAFPAWAQLQLEDGPRETSRALRGVWPWETSGSPACWWGRSQRNFPTTTGLSEDLQLLHCSYCDFFLGLRLFLEEFLNVLHGFGNSVAPILCSLLFWLFGLDLLKCRLQVA